MDNTVQDIFGNLNGYSKNSFKGTIKSFWKETLPLDTLDLILKYAKETKKLNSMS